MSDKELDRDRVEGLTADILKLIRENFKRGPVSRDRCLEALNALAAATVIIIDGADGRGGEAHNFFEKALDKIWE